MPYQIYKVYHGGGTFRYTLREEITWKVLSIAVTRDPNNPPSAMSKWCDRLNADYEPVAVDVMMAGNALETR